MKNKMENNFKIDEELLESIEKISADFGKNPNVVVNKIVKGYLVKIGQLKKLKKTQKD